ncbi:stage V sporulation protein B [Aeribacillus sp. FSL K6-2848]|uniref:stage V sporulation protein B n=1 Tax=unclassified Aeribacillus TaxID=2640495 RepID=UPI0030FBA8D8
MPKQTFLKGMLILMTAGLITRILGFINRIVIARMIGEEGVGLYMMAMPTFGLVAAATQLGLPVAISKLVAEADAIGDSKKVKKILVVSLTITCSLSIIIAPLVLFSASYISETLLTDPRTFFPLISITPVIPIIAVSSVLRGYFQGKQNMTPAAFSQVLEQAVRIAFIAVCTKAMLPYGIEYAAAGAFVAAAIGELASLLYLLIAFRFKKQIRVRKSFFRSLKKGKETFSQLMKIALPTTGSRFIGNISWFLEPIVVSHSLLIAGVHSSLATKQYGELTGYALPLLMLPSFITFSLSTSLVPALSEAIAQKRIRLAEYRLRQALRLSLVTGGLAVVILYVYAEPIMIFMYGNAQSAIYVKVMAPFFIFYYFQGPLQAALQALNLAKAAMTNSLIGSILKTALIFVFATRPELGIIGAALAIISGFMIVTLLHYATVLKVFKFTIYLRDYVLSFAAIFLTGWISYHIYDILLEQLHLLPKLMYACMITTVIYSLFLIIFRLVEKEEVKRIPLIGPYIAIFIPMQKNR